MRIRKIVFIAVLSILAMVVLTSVPFLINRLKNRHLVKVAVHTSGTIVANNFNIPPNIPSSIPSSTSVVPSINIIEILTGVSLAVTIVIGILKISGRNLYIGSKKKRPYIDILGVLRKLRKYLLRFNDNSKLES